MTIDETEIIAKYTEELTRILKTDKFSLENTSSETPYTSKLLIGKWQLKIGKDVISSFEVYPMINCCGIAVSTSAYVSKDYRGKGLGTLLNQFRIDLARNSGYGLLMCTDVESNKEQRSILARNGWKDIHKFVNPRTKNTVCISVIGL